MATHAQLALATLPVLLLVVAWMVRQWHVGVKERLDEMRSRLRVLEQDAVRFEALERAVDRLDRKVHSMEVRYLSYLAAESTDAEPQ